MGPFVDDADGKTAETGLTIVQADIRLSKDGSDFAQTNNSAGAAHDENGYYGVPLDATDTDTLGSLRVAIHKSGALPVWQDFMVMPAHVYDWLLGSNGIYETAAKVLINKAVQTKSTGLIEYFDDDGQTVILTHTPDDTESSITRAPS
ncbi:MAG TPA: hypothetical protein VMX13_01035 [Sedimentisphaerales bacterium]|nr:hypothetical protein [Sedimentisphaerales bacterium]